MVSEKRVIAVLGPIGLSMDDGWSRIDYLKMRAIVIREIKRILKDEKVELIAHGLPWTGIVAIDAASKIKDRRLSVSIELPSRIDEIHTPDRKMWDGRFVGDKDGSRANSAHFGFRQVTKMPSMKMLYEATLECRTNINNSIRGAFFSILKKADTALVFPTADVAMRELIDEFKERKSKTVIEIDAKALYSESVVPKGDRILVLEKAVNILHQNEYGIIDSVPGDIFVEAANVLRAYSVKKKIMEKRDRSSPCMTSPPDNPY
jgi:hypothetical protein